MNSKIILLCAALCIVPLGAKPPHDVVYENALRTKISSMVHTSGYELCNGNLSDYEQLLPAINTTINEYEPLIQATLITATLIHLTVSQAVRAFCNAVEHFDEKPYEQAIKDNIIDCLFDPEIYVQSDDKD